MSKTLGRYTLDRKLATGGMAEIWVGHQQGPAGFEKEVVIKKILPHLAEDPKFIDMFLDEARLAAKLSHPNIVQIFDLGAADGEHFIAMEFIDGRDVQAIIDQCAQTSFAFSPAIAARIVADACTALDYAHTFTDRDGTHVQLVHRDVSPQNILVSNDGIVKLVDFGVAKAATSTHKTQTGAVKGKLSYMSPEQISGKNIDARSDIFALGIVLYELVTGRRPFGHESELLAITAILNEHPARPCEVIVGIPLELEAIILRALEKDPNRRFQSASEMHIALEHVLRQMGAILTSREVKSYLEDIFSDSPTGTIPALSGVHVSPSGSVTHVEHPSAETRPEHPAAGVPAGTSGGIAANVSGGSAVPVSAAMSDQVMLRGALADAARATHSVPEEPQRSGKGPVMVALAIVMLLLVGGAVGLFVLFGPGSQDDPPPVDASTVAEDDDSGAEQAPDATTESPDASAVVEATEDAALPDAPTAEADADDSEKPEGSGEIVVDSDLDAGDEGSGEATADAEPVPANEAQDVGSDTPPESEAEDVAEPEADPTEPEEVDEPDEPERVDEPVEPEPRRERDGTVHFVVSGGRATFFIDDRRVGSYPGNTRFEVPAGRHRVRVESGDGETFSSTVEVEGGETERVRVSY